MDIQLYSLEQLCLFIEKFDPFQKGDVFEINFNHIEQLNWLNKGN